MKILVMVLLVWIMVLQAQLVVVDAHLRMHDRDIKINLNLLTTLSGQTVGLAQSVTDLMKKIPVSKTKEQHEDSSNGG